MAKRSGLGQKFYVCQIGSGPAYDLSGDIGSIDTASSKFATLEETGIDKSAMERLAGLGDGDAAFTSFWNNAAGGAHAVLRGLNGLPVRVMWLGSSTVGDGLAYVLSGIMDNYPPNRVASGALTAKPTAKSYNGDFPDWGRVALSGTDASGVLPHNSIDFGSDPSQPSFSITDASVANPTVVTAAGHGYSNGDSVSISGSNSTPSIDGDWVVSSVTTNTFTIPVNVTVHSTAGSVTKTSLRLGCTLTAFLTSIGSGTNYTIKAQHSADDGVVDAYADLSGMQTTSLTAAAAESRVRGSGTLLVKRYVRLVGQGTYTNAAAVAVFKRIAGAE